MNAMHCRPAVALLAVVIGAGCGKTRTDQPVASTRETGSSSSSAAGTVAAARGRSLVRLINAVPGMSVTLTGDERAVASGITYKDVTPYHEVADNVIKFRITPAGRDTVLADNTETLADGNRYTIVAYKDEDGEVHTRILRDEVVPDSGKARIRVINTATGIGDVDVAVRGQRDALFSDVHPGTEAGPKDVAPAALTLDIRTDSSGARAIQKAVTLRAGRAHTIVIAGRPGAIEVFAFDDAEIGPAGRSANR